jgi:hypothetical protein
MTWDVRRVAGICSVRLSKYQYDGRAAPQHVCSVDTNAVADIVEASTIEINVLVTVDDRKKYWTA